MKKLISTITVIFTFLFVLIAFEARADLVDDLIKKHKLDPKNNPKDQCELMFMLELELDKPVFKGNHCKGDVCKTFTAMYHFNKKDGNWYGPGHSYLIYRKSSYKIIGRSLDPENYYELSDQEFLKYVKKETGYMIDITKHEKFSEAEKQWNEQLSFDQELRKAKTPMEQMNLRRKRNKPLTISVGGKFNDGELRLTDTENKIKNISYVKTRGCYITESNLIKEYLQKNLTKNSN